MYTNILILPFVVVFQKDKYAILHFVRARGGVRVISTDLYPGPTIRIARVYGA